MLSCTAEIFDNSLEEIGGKRGSSIEGIQAAGHYQGCSEHRQCGQHHFLTIMPHIANPYFFKLSSFLSFKISTNHHNPVCNCQSITKLILIGQLVIVYTQPFFLRKHNILQYLGRLQMNRLLWLS